MFDVLPEIRPLLVEDRPDTLGPGAPNLAVQAQLQALEGKLAPKVKNRDFAAACLAGLWLYHDFFDESHAISQDLGTLEGSYWHGILHRREADYGNAKYWFRRVPGHPAFGDLCEGARSLAFQQASVPKGGEFLLRQETWDPFAFVDLCESAARGRGGLERLCVQIQATEFDLLFRYCHERAFAG